MRRRRPPLEGINPSRNRRSSITGSMFKNSKRKLKRLRRVALTLSRIVIITDILIFLDNEKNEKMLRLKKMSTLLDMHDKMKKNRIRDWQKNFTREEINMIEDAKILRKNGKLDLF